MTRRSLFICLCLCGCTASGSSTVNQSTTAPTAKPTTRYRLGDFVVYRYSGSFTAQPVTMREEVTAQEGARLRIDVTATRGSDVRRWMQVVTDTPANEENNVLDALYEMQDGKLVQLGNEKNADILRLSSWVLLSPDGRATDVSSGSCKAQVGGVEYACTCTNGKNSLHGAPITFHTSECPDFLWTHAAASFKNAEGENVLAVEVVEAGRVSGAKAQPFEP